MKTCNPSANGRFSWDLGTFWKQMFPYSHFFYLDRYVIKTMRLELNLWASQTSPLVELQWKRSSLSLGNVPAGSKNMGRGSRATNPNFTMFASLRTHPHTFTSKHPHILTYTNMHTHTHTGGYFEGELRFCQYCQLTFLWINVSFHSKVILHRPQVM
jgi:hypothetical protein